MSTFYTLIKEKDYNNSASDDLLNEFGIDERSNKLALVTTGNEKSPWIQTEELPPEEMAKVFLKGLTVCSYWMDTDKLKEMIKNHIEKEIY